MGVPLLATSWWSLLLGLYGYVLPFVLYATWVAIAMWDLIRRDADSIPARAGWRSCCSSRSRAVALPRVRPFPIPSQLRLMLTVGGMARTSSSSYSGSCSEARARAGSASA